MRILEVVKSLIVQVGEGGDIYLLLKLKVNPQGRNLYKGTLLIGRVISPAELTKDNIFYCVF